MSLSPLAKKGKAKALASKPSRKSSVVPQPIIEKRPFISDPPMLPSDAEDAELTETEFDDDGISSVAPSGTTTSDLEDQEEDEEYTEEEEDEYEEEEIWEPAANKTPKLKKQVILSPSVSPSPQPKRRQATTSKAPTKYPRISKLAQDMDELNINGDSTDDSDIILSKSERNDEEGVGTGDSFNLPVTKKKMRWALNTIY